MVLQGSVPMLGVSELMTNVDPTTTGTLITKVAPLGHLVPAVGPLYPERLVITPAVLSRPVRLPVNDAPKQPRIGPKQVFKVMTLYCGSA
ncbi:hypothetical protein BC943DRAFT_331187, partial [Umbelopsis sp. AD052]